MLFSAKDLRKLIIPLIIEQLLAVTVGMVDVMMISGVGEAAVSGVSLVDSVNILLINLFAAFATGGAVIAGHYLGSNDEEGAKRTANQLMLFAGVIAIVIMAVTLFCRNLILTRLFGHIEADVLESARIYLLITTISFPFLSIYNSGAALFRAMGNSKVTMWVSLCMNVLNVTGNAILIFGFKMGVAGAAISTTFSRMVASVIITIMLLNRNRPIYLERRFKFRFEKAVIAKILYIGVPNGLENSMFQLGKIIVLSLVSTFGTYAIAANAVSNTLAMFQILPAMAINMATLTVISRCVGANDYEQAKYYTKLLLRITYAAVAVFGLAIIILCPSLVKLYNLSDKAAEVTIQIIRYHGICTMLIWAPSFSLVNTLRAAQDVKFTLIITVISMWIFRIGFSYILGDFWGMGVFGVWVAMTIDWTFRAICFTSRYLSGKWKKAYY